MHFSAALGLVICVTYYAYIACSIILWFYITSSTEVSARQCIRTNEAAANEKKLRQSSDRYPRHVLLNLASTGRSLTRAPLLHTAPPISGRAGLELNNSERSADRAAVVEIMARYLSLLHVLLVASIVGAFRSSPIGKNNQANLFIFPSLLGVVSLDGLHVYYEPLD